MRFFHISLLVVLPLAGCVSLLGGRESRLTVFAPKVKTTVDSSWPLVNWDLSITKPLATRMVDSSRILVRPRQNQLMVLHGMIWAQPATELVEDTILHAFEDSGRIKGVARSGSGIGADYQLLLDIRRFEADFEISQKPLAVIDLEVKLLNNQTQNIIGAHNFLFTSSMSSTDPAAICKAFNDVLESVSDAVVSWTLLTGQNAQHQ